MIKKIFLTLSVAALLFSVGCIAFSHWATPATIDKDAVKYAVDAGVADVNEYKGYPNLAKAEKLVKDVDEAHEAIQFKLEQEIQKDNHEYVRYAPTVLTNHTEAVAREQMWFGENGMLSMAAGVLGIGGLGGFIGLMRKRPGDVTQQEFTSALAEATGKSEIEIAEKTKYLTQIVKSVDLFRDEMKKQNPDVLHIMDSVLNDIQDSDTKVEIAKIKKTA